MLLNANFYMNNYLYMDIKNTDFYNEYVDVSLFNSCLKIVDITNYYLLYTNESSFKDIEITKKGIDIILNVFSMIFLYTKNLELTIEYTNNSIYYFIEYVSQIKTKNNEFVFVNLTIKDAILYVYRKSIYEINENHRRKYEPREHESTFFEIINLFIKTYSVILKKFINNKSYLTTDIQDIRSYLYKINSYIMTFFKTVETYTNIEDKELKYINDHDKNILYNVTYKGINYMYNKMIEYISYDYNNQIVEDYENEFEKISDKLKQIVFNYCEQLVDEES